MAVKPMKPYFNFDWLLVVPKQLSKVSRPIRSFGRTSTYDEQVRTIEAQANSIGNPLISNGLFTNRDWDAVSQSFLTYWII